MLGRGKRPSRKRPQRPPPASSDHICLPQRTLLHLHRPRQRLHPSARALAPSSLVNMFRSAVVRSLRASVPRAVRAPVSVQIRSSPSVRPSQFAPCFAAPAVRFYSAPAGLSKEEVEGRIVNLLKNFDKVCAPCGCLRIVIYGADKSISIGLRP